VPIYDASGSAQATAPTHIVRGTVVLAVNSATVSVTLTAPAAFGSLAYVCSAADLTAGNTSEPINVARTSGSSFTLSGSNAVKGNTLTYICFG
jgi:hypothetical protein